jgi:hypothetical protein
MKNQMLNEISKTAFLRRVTEATATFKKLWDEGTPVVADVSCADKVEGIMDAIADSSLDRVVKDAMATLIAAATKSAKKKSVRKPEDEELAAQFLTFVPFACVVPLRNRNNHKYTIGQPVIMIHGADGQNTEMFGMDKTGCIISKSPTAKDGLSHLPRLRKSLRPATSWEIRCLVDELYR